jgi:hypothetical protein
MKPIIQILIAGIFLISQNAFSQSSSSQANNENFKSIKLDDCYDFDDLIAGDSVVNQLGGYWRTWSGEFGYGEDAIVSDLYSFSPNNSFVVETNNDLVFTFGDETITSGQLTYSHQMYIPTGKSGYFNFQGDVLPGVEWVAEVYFNNDGTAYVQVWNEEFPFNFQHNTWFEVYAQFSLDAELASIKINGDIIHQWENTEGLGGINFYGLDGSAEAFYDDICKNPGYEPPELFPPCELEGPSTIPPWDIELTWTAPEDCGAGWIQWETGINTGNGAGLNNGGTFYVASRWTPADLVNYAGLTINQISFFPYEDPDAEFELMIWTGEDASTLVMSQFVESYNVNEFNNVELENPVIIDDSQELWFGYSITHEPGHMPAGHDNGPAVIGYGDMISLDGVAWQSASGWSDTFNWNLAAYVSPTGVYFPVLPLDKSVTHAIADPYFNYTSVDDKVVEFNPESTKDFTGYNVYRRFNTGTYQLIDFTTETYYSDYLPVPGYWSYYVTAVYDPEGESEPSNEWIIEIPVENALNEISQFHIFPNPATNYINVSGPLQINSIEIYNSTGELMLKKEINAQDYKLNATDLKPGLYLLNIKTEETEIVKRIVIK